MAGVAFFPADAGPRTLRFRRGRPGQPLGRPVDVHLDPGDLVVMEGLEFQRNFTHEVPKLAGRPPTVSLTSRCFTIGLATA